MPEQADSSPEGLFLLCVVVEMQEQEEGGEGMIKAYFTCDVCKGISPITGFRISYDFNKLVVNEGKAQLGMKPVAGQVEVCSFDCAVKHLRKQTKELFEPAPKRKEEIPQKGNSKKDTTLDK